VKEILNKKERDTLMDYMDKHDLIFMESNQRFFLIDRLNDVVFDMTASRYQVHEDLIIDLDSAIEVKIAPSRSLGIGGADEEESDRKQHRGIKR
jgi:hypothetical protein